MRQSTCKDCKHFVLHFTQVSNEYVATGMGHCTQMRMRIRKTDQKKCEHFVAPTA